MSNPCLSRDLRQFERLSYTVARARKDRSECMEELVRLWELRRHLWQRHPYYMNRVYSPPSVPERGRLLDFLDHAARLDVDDKKRGGIPC